MSTNSMPVAFREAARLFELAAPFLGAELQVGVQESGVG